MVRRGTQVRVWRPLPQISLAPEPGRRALPSAFRRAEEGPFSVLVLPGLVVEELSLVPAQVAEEPSSAPVPAGVALSSLQVLRAVAGLVLAGAAPSERGQAVEVPWLRAAEELTHPQSFPRPVAWL